MGLADRKITKVLGIILECDSVYLPPAKMQGRQFLGTRDSADAEELPGEDLEGVASIYLLAGDLDGEMDWSLADLTGIPGQGRGDNIRGNLGFFVRRVLMASYSVPSLVADS